MLATSLSVIAIAFWGQWGLASPCGKPHLEVRSLPGNVAGRAYPDRCLIQIDRARWRIGANACVTYVHEFGHIIGQDHSPDPNSPMYYAAPKKPRYPCADW